jgi:hypothetical protein
VKTGAVAGGALAFAAAYFVLVIFFLPQPYSVTLAPPKPAPVITGVTISDESIPLGSEFSIRVSAANRGKPADLQLVSVAFPNATRTGIVTVNDHNFKQTPSSIEPGDKIGYGYTGVQSVIASYPAVEAVSRPWEPGETYNIDISVRPDSEGRFMIFVESVRLPHNGDQAHYPNGGVLDQQDEYVSVYEVLVTKA